MKSAFGKNEAKGNKKYVCVGNIFLLDLELWDLRIEEKVKEERKKSLDRENELKFADTII